MTATKSQSKSTSECSTYAAASTASATTAGSRARTRRATPTPAAAIDAKAKKNPTTPVSLRNCSGTLCGSVTTMLFVRSSRWVSSNVPAPVPRHGCASHASHASCHQSQRLDELDVGQMLRAALERGVRSAAR